MSSEELPPDSRGEAALKKFHRGMRNLSRSLVALGAFQLIIGAALLTVIFEPPMLVLLGGLAFINLALALWLRQGRRWANYLVIAWSVVLLAAGCAGVGAQGEPDAARSPGAGVGACFGFLIGAALLYNAANNLSAARAARAAGVAVGGSPGKAGYALPVLLVLSGGAAITGVVLAMLPPSIPSAKWRQFAPPGLGFEVLAPGLPREERKAQDTPAGSVELHKFTVLARGNRELYMVVSTRFPEAAARQLGGPEKLVDLGRQDIVTASQGEVRAERRFTWDGHPAVELEVLPPQGAVIKARVVATPRQVYQVTAHIPRVRAESEDVRRFLDSFRITQP